MAEYKHYITQVHENGNVMISEDVVATIVEHAAQEIDGVADLFAKKTWSKTIKTIIGENNELTVCCNISVKYGYSIVEVSENVQQAVTSAVESMTGVKVTAMNVTVSGIAR